MCIMEVRPGQRSATMAQAMTHNISTIERDLDMLRVVLTKRNASQAELNRVNNMQEFLHDAYTIGLELFADEILGHLDHDEPVGNERVHVHSVDKDLIEAEMQVATRQAEEFETR